MPWRRHFREWNRRYRYGLLVPWFFLKWTALFWLCILHPVGDALRHWWGIPLVIGIPGGLIGFIYLQYPEADPGSWFWDEYFLRGLVGIIIVIGIWGLMAGAGLILIDIMPTETSIRGNELRCASETHNLCDCRCARVTIHKTVDDEDHTLWLVFGDVAHAVPLHPKVDLDRLRELLPCPLSIDDRSASADKPPGAKALRPE